MSKGSWKVNAKSQHEAINKLRRQLPHGQVLRVRTARKFQRGVYVVVGATKIRQKSSKLERVAVWKLRASKSLGRAP
jgi:hypothetical protein